MIQLVCLILAFILTSMDPETGCGLPLHQLVKKLNMEHQSTKVCIRSHFHMRQKRDFHNIFVHFQRSEEWTKSLAISTKVGFIGIFQVYT